MKVQSMFRIAGSLAVLGLVCGPAAARTVEIDFDAANFTPGAQIDNPYWPLIAGTSFVYAAESDEGCVVEKLTVTDETKSDFGGAYSSIVARVIDERAWLSEECDGHYVLHEATLDWYAQDNAGNIWYFGEDTESYDGDEECPDTGGSWEAGRDGAQPGVIMLAQPRVGDAYQQEFFEDEAEDNGKVLRLNAPVEIDAGSFAGCLKTKEWSPLEPGSIEHKYYCPSAGGLMLVNELKGGTLRVEFIGNTLPPGDFAPTGVCGD
jgi:hypothetical protein